MIQIGKNTDLLKAKPIAMQLRENQSEVNNKVMMFITKAAMQVGTELTPTMIELMAEDLIDAFKSDSLEDIAEALKKGRQGRYGKVYGKLNGIVLAEWMGKHLEEKAIAREKLLSQSKQNEEISQEEMNEIYISKMEEAEDDRKSKAEVIANANRVINRTLKKYKQ